MTSFILINVSDNEKLTKGEKTQTIESSIQPLSSTGDFLGLYTTLSTAAPPIPLNIDVVSFPAMNGAPTTISAAWNSFSFTQTGAFLPTNGTTYDPMMKEMVGFISGELQYLQYKDNPMAVNMGPMTFPVAAPVFLNGQYLAILVEDGGYATPPMLEADLVLFDPTFGNFSSLQHLQTTTPNPFTYFTHESMSSATNRVDELYFLSSTSLVIVTDFSIFTPHYCWIDLEPSNSSNNYHSFYGVEYKSPGVLLAIRETFVNNTPHLDLVEIYFNSTTCTVSSIVSVYDLQSNIPYAPGGWIINPEYYSTTYDSCRSTYYVSSRYDFVTSSRLIAIDIPGSSHVEQILPQYLFGIEWKQEPCPCEASFVYQQFSSCDKFNFINTSSGPAGMTCHWDFGDPGSGTSNTSVQCADMHQFSTCGTYNVCLTISAPDCMETICQPVTVTDITPPVALCKNNVVLLLNANCIANVNPTDIDAGSFDDCSLSSYVVTPNSFSQCGTFPVTLTVTDWCGNTSTCNTVVQVVDNILPVITPPADVYLTTISSNCMIVANGLQWIALSDNCGVSSVSYTVTGASNYAGIGDASGLNFNQGISTITYIATDHCGNSSSCSFLITIDCFCNCPGNLLRNGGFTSGTTVGDMAQNGTTDFWNLATESPQIAGSDFCCDANSIQMWGRTFNGESIYQSNVPILAGHHYKISFCGKYLALNPSAGYAQFGFTGGPIPTSGSFNPYNCTNCENAGSSSNISSTSWNAYTLPIWTPTQNWDRLYVRVFRNSNIQTWGRIDNICLEEVQYICCEDEQEFIENTDNSTNTYPESETREGVFEVGNLMECNSIDYIDWGDGSIITNGPIPGNSTLRHTYAEAGTYQTEYRVREFDPQDTSQLACLSHVFVDSIVILPDSCFCGGFSNMYIRSVNAPPGVAVYCGEAPVQVNCPSSNLSLQFTGIFNCVNESFCSNSSIVEWKLIRLPNDEVATGNIIASPFYDLSILPTWYALPGTYEIQLKGACGKNSCTCSVQFIVDCPETCICDSMDFENDLNRGFSTTLFENNCEVCFSSILLTDCDLIEWSIDGVSLGSTIGDIMFFHTFTADGTYAVTMAVTRFNPDGTICQIDTVTQDIIIKCGSTADCQNTIITNPDFNLGAVAGGINSGGVSQGWRGISGEPIVVEGEMGSSDGWSIQLDGNFDSSSILTTLEPVCLEKTSGNATLRFKIKKGSGKDMLVLKLYRLDAFDADVCNYETCYVIEDQKATPPPNPNQWVDLTFPYDLSDWLISDDCGVKPSVRVRPALYFFNHLSDDQGGIETKTIIAVDNFCLGGMLVNLDDLHLQKSIHLLPNPTPGSFTLTLPTLTIPGMSIRIVSLTGQTLLEKEAETGTDRQLLDAGNLPAGMYFVQLWNAGRLVGMEKLVKL